MNVEKESVLSREVIENFPRALNLDEKTQSEFQTIAVDWLQAIKEHEDALGLRVQRVALAQEDVSEAERRVVHAKETLEQSRRFAEHSKEDVSMVKGRIREKLDRLDTWPLWMRLARPLVKKFLGGEPVRVHPFVEPFVKGMQKAEVFVQETKVRFDAESERIEEEAQPAIAEAGRKVMAVESRLIGWIGRQVASSREKTIEAIRLVPHKREFFANIYARQNATSGQELKHFLLFVYNTSAFKWETLAPQHKIYWYGKRRAWVGELRAPTGDEYNELPDEVKRLWVNEVRRRVLADF